jgi:hypothetical protein
MILNMVLLALVFSSEKKKINPYVSALLLGVIKAVIYIFVSKNILGSVLMGGIYALLAVGFVFFLKRLNKREDSEKPDVPVYRTAGTSKGKFKWEYIPLVVLLLLIIGGEYLLI